ncbi:MAG: glycoside hydrolase family 3 C-terminal domain-containing protein [candidate division KSB1 bacterium]|nr:glycoside hydrolase family 3 C-terminal domain-containing protein [candidate division KSB1 bacterium]
MAHEKFRDTDTPADERIKDLLSKMTLEEKVSQMLHESAAIPKLGIPAYTWWNECLHGVARSGRASVFPQAIGMAAAFDDDLVYRVADAISDEARAIFHAAEDRKSLPRYSGLTFWTPNINIFRDPRWGRGQETYGEDPVLTARLGVAFVKGLQGDHPKYMKAAACAKHYAVHSGPEGNRHHFNAQAGLKDMQETYLPAFKALVDAGVEAVMCAYNRTNDEACCGSQVLIQDILRDHWGFEGHVVSDCWAIRDFHEHHNVTKNAVESAALALKRGINLNCGDVYKNLTQAVNQGLVEEKEIDKSLAYLLKTKIKLGLFDPPENNPYTQIGTEVIGCEKHRQLSSEVAQKSVVLLKNDGILPLKKDIRYLFVTGPQATSTEVLMGNYYGVNEKMVTLLEGVVNKLEVGSFIQYKHGCLLDRDNANPFDWTSGDATEADATIAFVGISALLEGEEGEAIASPTLGDRIHMDFPENQIKFLKKLRKKSDKPIIAVVTGGSPMEMHEVHDIADAVLWVGYPGQEGGNAVADILFGDACPSGRLPITFPMSVEDLPPFENYDMTDRTYRYMSKKPMYPFGFGLSYSRFEYSNLELEKTQISKKDSVRAQVTVKNTGDLAGDEVVQLYVSDVEATVRVPNWALKDFRRVSLESGKSQSVTFELTPDMFSLIDEKGNHLIEPGDFRVLIGGCSPGERGAELGACEPAEAVITVK